MPRKEKSDLWLLSKDLQDVAATLTDALHEHDVDRFVDELLDANEAGSINIESGKAKRLGEEIVGLFRSPSLLKESARLSNIGQQISIVTVSSALRLDSLRPLGLSAYGLRRPKVIKEMNLALSESTLQSMGLKDVTARLEPLGLCLAKTRSREALKNVIYCAPQP